MAGRHSEKTSKAPIIIIVAIIILIIAVGIFAFFANSQNTDMLVTETQPLSTTEQSTDTNSQSQIPQEATTVSVTEEQGVTSGETVKVDVVVPTQQGAEVSYFDATYSPSKAVDTATGNECSLKEVFGSSYSGGVIKFSSDGTFDDQIISSKGAYAVSNKTISATYVNDKNMDITVNSWSNDKPSEFVINYGGYDVYFEG